MKRIIALILILVPLLTALALGVEFMCGYEVHRDVSYGELGCEEMDIFIPDEAYERESNGCVLLIHGGSWSGGDKREEELMSRYIANKGYIAVTMNYSLSVSDGSYSVGLVLDEIDMAIGKICSFAAEKGITVGEIATYGYSAGAHLAMLYSYSRGAKAPIRVKFTANMAGPADICADVWGEEKAIKIAAILSGKPVTDEMIESGEVWDMLAFYSPTSYISASTPPTLFAYGGKDTTVTEKNADSLKAGLDAAGVRYDYIYFENSDHTLLQNFGKRIKFAIKVIDYCDEYFTGE